ncbi:MAG: chemotaxis protein CheY [Fibrobacteres bacterium]|nr:chemotaxis protein CheY [Fibrobacterota bacterium]
MESSAPIAGPAPAADPALPGRRPAAAGVASMRPHPGGLIFAPGSPLEAVLRFAEAAARRECPVFLRGESGSGKEVVAHFLHARSGRARGPFVAVNCAALPHTLIESELFGHRKGAFTGAYADSPGRFRQAEGGTLFLDEIGDMPLEVQTRLLRTLQEKTVSPVGDGREYPVDFRLVCATHRDLRREVREGRFREDLFYRLDVVEIRLPPLRERRMDIAPLMRHFLSESLPALAAEIAWTEFPPAFLSLPFPGNVRELRNLAERYCVLREMGAGWAEAADGSAGVEAGAGESAPAKATCNPDVTGAPGKIRTGVSEMLPGAAAESPDPEGRGIYARIRNSRLSDGEILHALDVCGRHRARASALLGISRRALQYRLAKMSRTIPT